MYVYVNDSMYVVVCVNMTDGMYMCIYDYKQRYAGEYMYLYDCAYVYGYVCMNMYASVRVSMYV